MPEHPRRHRHRKDPLPVSAALRRFRRAGGAPAAAGPASMAAAAWSGVVGEVGAAHSVPVRCTRAGVVTIACSDSSWAHELSMRREELTARLVESCPGAGIVGLRFAVADHALAPIEAAPAPAPRPPAPTAAQRAAGQAAAADVADPVLRALVARATAASAARRRGASDT